jgi:hypothetical protein
MCVYPTTFEGDDGKLKLLFDTGCRSFRALESSKLCHLLSSIALSTELH